MSGSPTPRDGVDSDFSGRDSAARIAGVLLILTAVITAVSAAGRVAADADQHTLAESLEAISLNTGLYGLGGATRLLAGIALVVAAKFLLRTWVIRKRLGSSMFPILFRVSGIFTAISGTCSLLLAITVSDLFAMTSESGVSRFLEVTDLLRWLAGKTGFAMGGLALVVASRSQWKVGGALRLIAPASAILGVAMQLIWIDAATVLHSIVGAAFFVWLLGVGSMLYTDRTEKAAAFFAQE